MKKFNLGKRLIALVLVLIMVMSLVPLSVFAATKGDIVTSENKGVVGFDTSTLNQNGTINWPVKIYDYLSDGMLFEFAQYQGSTLYSSSTYGTNGGGQYVLGDPMPYGKHNLYSGVYVTDYTIDETYSSNAYVSQWASGRGARYTRTAVAASNYNNPRYVRYKINSSGSSSSNRNIVVSDFRNDIGFNMFHSTIRYMVIAYRSSGMATTTTNDYLGSSMAPLEILLNPVSSDSATESSSWSRKYVNNWTNSSEWTYRVLDLNALGFTSSYTTSLSLSPNFSSTSSYLDISHIGYFSTQEAAETYGKNCVAFNKNPGEYIKGTTWNSANNTAFGMLFASNGADHDAKSYGGNTTNANAGYYTHQIGYRLPAYASDAASYNDNRKDGKDADGRYNGTGNKIGDSNQIYFITNGYATSSEYQANHSGATSYDMSELTFDGYNLLTQASKGSWTAGLLEGKLGEDGTPVYRQETVEYIADLLSKTLTIPQYDPTGKPNYSYVSGGKSTLFGTTNGKVNDLAQGLRNCLGITFSSGASRGTTPKMGTYDETMAKADKLKGKFLPIANAGHISTCMDAAYYILNNLFIDDSYNQTQDDFNYFKLSSVTLDNGTEAFVFDGGFSVGAELEDLISGNLTQEQYKANTQNAVVYDSFNGQNGAGTGSIYLNKVQEKDLFYYANAEYARTTRYPFLPVVDSEGDFAGQTDSYYFAEDGKRNFDTQWGTYYGRNFGYTLVSNGEFVFVEDDELFFEFEGDDDVYLFINGELVMDLGGGHSISNCSLKVNDYVEWARNVLANPSQYSDRDIERAQALNLEDGEIATFDFYYMERHGYGANMRVVTNMHITDPALRTEKRAYQGGKEIDFGGIIDADYPVEYNFTIRNQGNTKLYNLTFDDKDVYVSLTPEKGLYVQGDGNASVTDDKNGSVVTDAQGGRLDATDLTAVVEGYQKVDSGGDYIKTGKTYTKVEKGAGTHIYHDGILVQFTSNDALKAFLKTLEAEGTDNSLVDEEQTQAGAGLWVDASVTFKGIYYALEEDEKVAGVFNNKVSTTATTKTDPEDPASILLESESQHRVYLRAIPSYYQWAEHEVFITEQQILDDASSESNNDGSLLSEYHQFFVDVAGNTGVIYTQFCDKNGNIIYPAETDPVVFHTAADGQWGCKANYDEPGVYEFYLFMRKQSVGTDISKLSKSDYAIVRVLVIVADVEDSEYVLDYGLRTENLDTNGELFKDDELLGSMSGTDTKLMGISTQLPSYLKVTNNTSDYNRINFTSADLSGSNEIDVVGSDGEVDGHFTANLNIGDEGKQIKYDKYSGMYTLTDSGTVTIHASVPYAWRDLSIYYWYDNGTNNGWPGVPMTKTSAGTYNLAIPGNVPHVILTATIPVYNDNGEEISTEFRQTVDINLNAGEEAWITVDPTLNADGKYPAAVKYNTTDGIIHAAIPDDWSEVYYHCWDGFGNPLTEWPGTKLDAKDGDGYYTFTIPGDITNIILNNGKGNGKQTGDLIVSAGKESWITVSNNNPSHNEETNTYYYNATVSLSNQTVTMHATVPDDWNAAYLYYWNSNGSSTGVGWPGLPMTADSNPENAGLYHIDGIPADVTNVIINNGIEEKNEDSYYAAKQTVDTMITPGLETWFNVNDTRTTVKVSVPDSWGTDIRFYFFVNGKAVDATWSGLSPTRNSDGTYSMNVPARAEYFIVNNNNNGKQTQDIRIVPNKDNEYVIGGDDKAYATSDTVVSVSVPDGWGNVHIHNWSNGGYSTQWAGPQAEYDEATGRYKLTLMTADQRTNFVDSFIVNNNSGKQTGNIEKMLYFGGETLVDVYYDENNNIAYNTYNVEPKEDKHTMSVTYGENSLEEGFSFTPTNFMDSVYNLYLAITVHEPTVNLGTDRSGKPTVIGNKKAPSENPNVDYTVDIGKEVQMYKKISVLPANVVYYEDDFDGITYTSSAPNMMNHYGDGSGSLTQKVDQNTQYGNDIVYQGSENDEQTGGSLLDIDIKKNSELAKFTFKGTGFEIIGHTHAVEAGTVMVNITGTNGYQNSFPVITEFDNGDDGGTDSIVAIPIIRVSGLEYGEYTVSIDGIPVFDWDNWDRVNMPPTKTSYICIDGVRIYQPLQGNLPGSEYGLVSLGALCYPETGVHSTSHNSADPTDGIAYAGTNWEEATWLGFNKAVNVDTHGQGVLRVDLGKVYTIDFLRANVFSTVESASIGNPTYIEIYYAEKETDQYKKAGNLIIGTKANLAYWANFLPADGVDTFDAQYIKFKFGPACNDLYWVMVDEIEVYGYEKGEVVDGYHDAYLDTEKGATFSEVRQLISDRQAFVVDYNDTDGLIVSGGTTTWTENRNNTDPSDPRREWTGNKVTSVADYLLAGPNNEVYMVESTNEQSSALSFYVTETGNGVHNMQIGIRAMDYGAFIGASTTGLIDTTVQYGAMVDGKLVWKTLANMVSTAEQYYTIPYTECPYDAENNRYQVVLRVADTAVTGMASYTTLKTNGLFLNTLNSSDLPEVIYKDELANEMIDIYGNTIDTSKYVNFLQLSNQMRSNTVINTVMQDDGATVEYVDGVNTSSMSSLYDSFTAQSGYDFALTSKSKFYIVTSSESVAPSQEVIDTVKLIQKQFAADGLPTSENLRIVWGLAEYAEPGDILIYVNSGYFADTTGGYFDDGFKLDVTDKAVVMARTDRGAMYALNTLQKHFRKAGTNVLEGFKIVDAPDTRDRIVHLDMARKYLTKNWICNYIREMAWMGYNSIELHLSEDGGFRSDIWNEETMKLSGMTGNDFSWAIGSEKQSWAYTGDDVDKGLYLTTEELIEICNVAKEYNIDIIPSFDSPAHIDWITKTYERQVSAGNTSIKTFKYNGATYTLPNTIHYNSGYTALNLGNTNVKKLAFALYNDIAVFFKHYAGSTKFNIGGDEVGLYSSSGYTYNDCFVYFNEVNEVLKKHGYTSRLYNDFLYNSDYSTPTTQLASDIEIVIWAQDSTTRTSAQWVNTGRTIYGGINYWTYYVLRYFDHPSYTSNAIWGMDARHPNNTWWSFYRNHEKNIYEEWTAGLLSNYGATKYELTTSQLGGGYFMVWCDNSAISTEQEMWYGAPDRTEYASTSGAPYLLIDRMWSSAIKQWNADINSTLSFALYKTLRDAMGYFPGLASGSNGCSEPTTLKAAGEVYGPFRTEYTVTFVDYDGSVIDSQVVIEGNDAIAPEDPVRESDAWLTYEFTGWSDTFTNITDDKIIFAQYSSTSTVPGIYGNLEVEVSGGSNFNLSVAGGASRPMGTSYKNARMDLGTKITVSAETTAGNKFIGWINAATSEIVSSNLSYTFYTSGSDILIALFDTNLANMSTVIFKHDLANQIIDIQYYSVDSEIKFPEAPTYLGYEFLGWNFTETEIKEKIVDGVDVTVLPVWGLKDTFVSVNVTGGSVTDFGDKDKSGKYVAYKGTTVTADEAPQGKKFAYWIDADDKVVSYDAVYKFYPYKDTTLTAVFVNEAETVNYDVIVDVAVDTTTHADKNNIFLSWSVPESTGYTFVNAGVLIVDQKDYIESKFAVGTNDGNIIQFVPARKYQIATNMHSITQTGVAKGETKLVRAFVQYRDADSRLWVAYSDTITVTK